MSLRLRDLDVECLRARLREGRLGVRTGPFWVRIKSAEASVAAGLRLLYSVHPAEVDPPFADFHVELARVGGPRRWVRPQVTFTMDGIEPFKPLAANQAFPLLEWGLNWCITSFGHRWLLLHSAVLARGEDALLLPASSGSGKSTLCAALALSGWRLLSDELAMLEPESGRVRPLVRPIGIKNQSIDVIARAFPEAVVTVPVFDTKKGTVAHVAPTATSVLTMHESVRVRWVVFPKWQAGAATTLDPMAPADVMLGIVQNAFNYNVQGEQGFRVATDVARSARGFRFTYSNLGEAMKAFGALS